MTTVSSWSFSRLLDFEKCPFRFRLKYVDKIAEPPSPASERGIAVHKQAEDYIAGLTPELAPELASFSETFSKIRDLHKEGKVSVEEDWGFDRNWAPCGWNDPDVWLRVKLDAYIALDDIHALVIDHKTGKRAGNEIKHTEQGMLYAVAAYMRNPALRRVTVEFNYTDLGFTHSGEVTPAMASRATAKFEKRAAALLNCRDFKPKPNIFNCRFCPYGKKGSGHCEVSA